MGRKPQNPEHGPLSSNERSARRRAVLAEQAQAVIDNPCEASNMPGPALVRALQVQLAAIDSDPAAASRMTAGATVAAIVRKYRLELPA